MKQIQNDFEGLEFVISQPKYDIANCDMKALTQYKQKLREKIVNGQNEIEICEDSPFFLSKNRNVFRVFSLECGTGKSFTALMSIILKYTNTFQKGMIYVTKLIKDGNNIAQEINSAFQEDVAFALNSETVNGNIDMEQKIKKYPIIIITHEQYKILAKNKTLRKKFVANRELLLIDEWLSLCEKKEITRSDIVLLESQLQDKYLIDLFHEITLEIEKCLIKETKGRKFFNAESNVNEIRKKCNKLKGMINENLDDNSLASFGNTKKELCRQIDNIVHFYNETCLLWEHKLYTIDRTLKYWTLNNNIILDASASLNGAYRLRKNLFVLEDYKSVLDYSKWEIININENSSQNGQKNYTNYFEIVKKIADNLGKDETLIVDKKENANKQYFGYHSSYYANLRSNNNYKDMKNVIIAYTPYLPDIDTVLEYMYFSQNDYCNEEDSETYWWCEITEWTGRKNGGIYELSNKDFEFYRKEQVANEIYQAIKRVNRDMTRNTKVVFITKDTQVFDMVTAMLPNCKITYYSEYNTEKYSFTYKKMPKQIGETTGVEQRKTYVEKAILLFNKILCGEIPTELILKDKTDNIVHNKYKKSAVGQYIGIDYSKSSGRSILANKVLKNTDFLRFMECNNITEKGQYFYINQ